MTKLVGRGVPSGAEARVIFLLLRQSGRQGSAAHSSRWSRDEWGTVFDLCQQSKGAEAMGGSPATRQLRYGWVTLFICNVTAVCENSLPSMDA
jgi:hypothetical protein